MWMSWDRSVWSTLRRLISGHLSANMKMRSDLILRCMRGTDRGWTHIRTSLSFLIKRRPVPTVGRMFVMMMNVFFPEIGIWIPQPNKLLGCERGDVVKVQGGCK